jgi:hypothetical protein
MEKKTKKKLYALLLATILAVGVSAAAIASNVSSNDASGNDASGNAVASPLPLAEIDALAVGATVTGSNLVVTPINHEMLNHMKDLRANNTNDFNTAFSIPYNAKLVAAFNLNLKPGEVMPAGGLIVPIKINGAKAGDYAIVLHRRPDYFWEVVARGFLTGDLTINATFTTFSPVMVLLITAEDAAAGGILSPGTED